MLRCINVPLFEDLAGRGNSAIIELIHSSFKPDRAECFDRLGSHFGALGQCCGLLFCPFAQYVVDLHSFRKIAPDAEPQPGICIRAEQFGYIFKPVMSPVASFGPDARIVPNGSAMSSTMTKTFSNGIFSACIQ